MNRERLELMVTMLEEVEAGTWEPNDDANLPEMLRPTESVSFDLKHWGGPKGMCGYAACAIGHACMDARFTHLTNNTELSIAPRCGGEVGWAAVYRYFDIPQKVAKNLFSDGRYPDYIAGPLDVARRITQLLEANA